MGDTSQIEKELDHRPKPTNKTQTKMAFYMLEQPMFHLEPVMSSGFYPRTERYPNLMEQLLEEALNKYCETDYESDSDDYSMDEEEQHHTDKEKVSKQPESENEASKAIIETNINMEVSSAKQGFKRILNNIKEDLEKVEIQIELVGYKFKGEHFEVRVVDDNLLDIKAEGNDQKYHKQFKLASNAIIEKTESKFECNEEDKQTLTIKVPKNVKIFQVPIAMEDQN